PVMAMHNTNSLLKYVAIPVLFITLICIISSWFHRQPLISTPSVQTKEQPIKDSASNDSAAESLDTLTADLSKTKQKILEVSKDNETFKQQNTQLLNQVNAKQTEESAKLIEEIAVLKNQIQEKSQTDNTSSMASSQ